MMWYGTIPKLTLPLFSVKVAAWKLKKGFRELDYAPGTHFQE